VFTCCNIHSVTQLNCLSDLKKLDNLTIKPDDNPITSMQIWRFYAIFRLQHLQIKRIDDKPISSFELSTAEKLFSPLINLILDLPENRIANVIGQHRRKQIKIAKEIQVATPPTVEHIQARDIVSKLFLTSYVSPGKQASAQSELESRPMVVKAFIDEIYSNINYNDLKKQKLKKLQSQLWNQFVDKCVDDCLFSNDYVSSLCKKHGIVL
jgi:leucine-rich repeat-containing protein 49